MTDAIVIVGIAAACVAIATVTTKGLVMSDLEAEADCPNEADHFEPGIPEGYLEQREWKVRMRKQYAQKRCLGCGLWRIWVKRK